MDSKFHLIDDDGQKGYYVTRRNLLCVVGIGIGLLIGACVISVTATYMSMKQSDTGTSPSGGTSSKLSSGKGVQRCPTVDENDNAKTRETTVSSKEKKSTAFETTTVSSNPYTVADTSVTSGIVFDLSSINKKIFASKNRTFLSNTNFTDAIAGPGIRGLTEFYGSLINRYVTSADDLSFDVTLKYEIIKDPARYMLFGIALCTRCDMDKKHYGSNTCWLLQIADKNDDIRAEFYNNSKIWKTVVVSSAALGTKKILRYTISVSGPKKTISYKDRDTGITLYTFSGVDFSEPLFPLFGVYSKTHFTSSLSLA